MLACSALMVALLFCPADYPGTALPPAAMDGFIRPTADVRMQTQTVVSPTGKASTVPDQPQEPQAAVSETSPGNEPPMPATTGVPGLFTVETAETLPKGAIVASAYVNKFSRAPGSVTFLNGGMSVGAGLTNKITLFAQFEPYRHIHVSQPSELSLRQPAGCPHDVFDAPIYCGLNTGVTNNTWKGPAAGYVEDFPFAAYDTSDLGPVTLGFKMNFWSEKRGDPLSVSLRSAVVVPTRSATWELANNGAQSGAFDYSFTLGLSKSLHGILLANNFTYLVVGNPRSHGVTLLTPPDEIIFGQGFIFPVSRRFQLLTEYTCIFYQEGHAFGLIGIDTENVSLGPMDPVDGVWGVRWYFKRNSAVDVAYRYMLNLHQVDDRNGFIIKIGRRFR